MKIAMFDLDGTLFGTNDINYYAYKEALGKYNVDLDYDYFCDYCNGRNYRVFLPKLLDNDDAKIEDVHNSKKQLYSKYLDKVIINNHLFSIINAIKNDYKIVLVTTASKKNTLEILNYTSKTELFDYIITGDDITKNKPDPEGFNKAIAYYNADPKDVIIFEDSSVGIKAALKTGAVVFEIKKFY